MGSECLAHKDGSMECTPFAIFPMSPALSQLKKHPRLTNLNDSVWRNLFFDFSTVGSESPLVQLTAEN